LIAAPSGHSRLLARLHGSRYGLGTVKRLGLLASTAIGVLSCAEPLRLADRGLSAGVSPYSFWPPPPSSALWLPPSSPPAATPGLGPVALELGRGLANSGYADCRWYPIGSGYQHGFAITTRLERTDSERGATARRWSAFYPVPADLRWLTFAQTPALPQRGQYRAFLIAFTDLPTSMGATAPIWNEQTLMDGPGAPERYEVPQIAEERQYTRSYRVGVYEYIYDWDEAQKRGRLRVASGANSFVWPSSLAALGVANDAER
jgi:hypothetical protein